MIMKAKLLYAAAAFAAVCTVSCRKDIVVNDSIPATGTTELTVGISGTLTKSSTITDDD